MKLTKKNDEKKSFKTIKILDSPYCNLHVHTHNTTVRVHGMLWCAKINYCTHTRTTHFGKPTGFPVPVPIPTPCSVPPPPHVNTKPFVNPHPNPPIAQMAVHKSREHCGDAELSIKLKKTVAFPQVISQPDILPPFAHTNPFALPHAAPKGAGRNC
jgi:hypothetical protein